MRVLGATGFQNVLRSHSRGGWGVFASREETGRPGRQSRLEPRLEPVPNEEGRDLMMSGTFGNNERRPNNRMRAKRAAWRVLEREIGGGGLGREKSGMRLLKQV